MVALGAKSKRAKQVRTGDEFDTARLASVLNGPKGARQPINAWSLEEIYSAREAQMRGDFRLAARAAEQMRTDDALYVAYGNRLDPQRCVDRRLLPVDNSRGKKIADEADALFGPKGVALHPDTLADINGCLVNHGVAFAQTVWLPRPDGVRVDCLIKFWPIDLVRWDPQRCCYLARVDVAEADPAELPADLIGNEVPIVHGDGRWLIFQKHEIDPFRQDAAVLSALLVWARHAFACRDWAKGSVSHGSAKVVGELAPGVPLNDKEGALTADAEAFLQLLGAIASGDTPVGIRPAGSKTDFLTNTSTAWQVWKELVDNAEKAAARIYLGTDGTLGSSGGAPGVDITALFGVALTKVRGDLDCMSRGINTAIEIWTAINFGDSTLAPKHEYLIPNEDAEQLADETSKRNQAYFADIKAARENGFDVTPEWAAKLAAKYGIEMPALKSLAPAQTSNAPAVAPTNPA